MAKTAVVLIKPAVLPSRAMNFPSSVPTERAMDRYAMFDSPVFWNSEYGYLGDAAADAAATPPEKTWYEKLIDIYGAVKAQQTAAKYQDQLINENLNRQRAGQAPLSMDKYMQYAAPQVNVGLSSSIQNMLIYGGIGLLGIFAVSMIMKRK
jgi:hypothetical protein